VRNAVVAG